MTEYGLQLYSVRDAMTADMAGTLKNVAELGYKTVETAGFFGKTADEFNALLKENALKLAGTHSSWVDLRDKYDEVVAFHKAIGNKRYIVPCADLSTAEKLNNFINFVNKTAPKLAEEGISLQFHNHSHEFKKNADGLIPEFELFERTQIALEIDTYWVYRAGFDPIEILEKFKGRVNVIHVKDGTMEQGLSLGLGNAPVKRVVEYAKKNGIDMVVESEDQQPDGISEVTRCIDYLKTLE